MRDRTVARRLTRLTHDTSPHTLSRSLYRSTCWGDVRDDDDTHIEIPEDAIPISRQFAARE